MKAVSQFMKNLPDGKAKDLSWENIMKKRAIFFENEYKRIDANIKIPEKDKQIICSEIIKVSTLELEGGSCFKCHREWKKIEFNNLFGKGIYYQPQCECLIKCPCCKNELYDYYVTTRLKMKKYRCPHCGFGLYVNDDPNCEKRFGKKYEIFYDSLKRKPAMIAKTKEEKEKKNKDDNRQGNLL